MLVLKTDIRFRASYRYPGRTGRVVVETKPTVFLDRHHIPMTLVDRVDHIYARDSEGDREVRARLTFPHDRAFH